MSLISKIIKTVLNAVYKVLSLFNLQLPLFILVLGTILFFTGAMENQVLFDVFKISFAVSLVLSIIVTIRKIFGLDKKKNRRKSNANVQVTPQPDPVITAQQPVYPKYYAVKQNSDYVMGEFEDRYELYKKTPEGLVLVRTDYKNLRN